MLYCIAMRRIATLYASSIPDSMNTSLFPVLLLPCFLSSCLLSSSRIVSMSLHTACQEYKSNFNRQTSITQPNEPCLRGMVMAGSEKAVSCNVRIRTSVLSVRVRAVLHFALLCVSNAQINRVKRGCESREYAEYQSPSQW